MVFDSYPHTCIGCGLLGRVDYSVHGTPLVEFNVQQRITGALGSTSVLMCQRRMAEPMVEFVSLLGLSVEDGSWGEALNRNTVTHEQRKEALATILQKHRAECLEAGRWIPYAENFSPQWHFEQQRMMELEKQRRDWEAGMEQERRDFDERLDNRNKEFLARLEQERREWESKSGSLERKLIAAAILLASLEVIGTLLGIPIITRFLGLD